MKTLYIIGGTMGVGKTTICKQLKLELKNSVFLDGDWCWDSSPFQLTNETKEMVIDNICYLLNNFLKCSAYENIIFCWVMHEQDIIDTIIKKLNKDSCIIKCISLMADEEYLRARLKSDIDKGIRNVDIIDKSIARLPLYKSLNAIKINTSNKSIFSICDEIMNI